ncbi:MAG: multidrug effflux MFS transporter [Leucobacter sp.]
MTAQRNLTPGLLAVLAFLVSVGPFATDMYLVSFTSISADLGASASAVQLTITAFLVGIGAGQLILGPLSDQYGRRTVLLITLTVFTASSIALVFTPNIEVFIALRLVQGLAGAGGIVISRAIAADLTEGDATIRALSLIATLIGLGPLIAPPIGGAVESLSSWRGVLAVLAALGVVMLLLAVFLVPESLPKHERHSAGFRPILSAFGTLLRDARFRMLLGTFGLAFAAIMAYISASPFVGQVVLGMSPLLYSLGFGVGALGLVGGSFASARLAGRVRPQLLILLGAALLLLSGAVALTTALTDTMTVPLFIAMAFVLSAGSGLIMSNSSAVALGLAGRARGSASALLGATQFALGAVVSPLVGAWGEDTAVPMAGFVLGTAIVAAAGSLAVLRAVR